MLGIKLRMTAATPENIILLFVGVFIILSFAFYVQIPFSHLTSKYRR
jgi:hypothetical protein